MVTGTLKLRHAQSYLAEGKLNQALSILLINQKKITSANYRRLTVELYTTIAQAYFDKGQYSKAKNYADLVIENILGLENTEPASQVYKLLYKISKIENKPALALRYHEQYALANKAYLDEVSAKSLAFQLAQHQAIQQKNEIALLNNQNELLNNKNELLRAQQSLAVSRAENSRLIASLLMAIIALLSFFGYRSWRTQRRLKTLAEYDYLTKVYNRGHFMTLAEETLKLATKAKQTVTCIIFDLDKFKKINDNYGHSAGDWALKAAASATQSCIRENDVFARLGGEEFVILLPGCDTSAACYVTEKCMRAFENIDTRASGHEFNITASFGITTSKISSTDIDALIADADKALYIAKNSGRNQYRIFEPTR